MEAIGQFLGDIIGRHMVEKFGNGLEGLKNALDYLFSWEKDFKLEVERISTDPYAFKFTMKD